MIAFKLYLYTYVHPIGILYIRTQWMCVCCILGANKYLYYMHEYRRRGRSVYLVSIADVHDHKVLTTSFS